MEWRDEGILLWVKRHGESSSIIEVLTPDHGRHAGLVRGGASKKAAAILQAGAQLSVEWNGRLSDHLGAYKIDLVRSRAATIMASLEALAALNAVSAMLVQFTPEREVCPGLYDSTLSLVDAMAAQDQHWPILYARWELLLLQSSGFGLDLTTCAATGMGSDLAYVSPRSGRAVSRAAGGPFAERLLPLPQFLIHEARASGADVREALRLTGFFFQHWACPAFDLQEPPKARERLVKLMKRLEFQSETRKKTFSEEDRLWLERYGAAPE